MQLWRTARETFPPPRLYTCLGGGGGDRLSLETREDKMYAILWDSTQWEQVAEGTTAGQKEDNFGPPRGKRTNLSLFVDYGLTLDGSL